VRNKCSIKGVFPKSPSEPLFKILSYLQRWRLALKEHDREKLDEQLQQMSSWLRGFACRPRNMALEDFL